MSVVKDAVAQEVERLYEALNEIHETLEGKDSESCKRQEANIKKLEASIRASQHIN